MLLYVINWSVTDALVSRIVTTVLVGLKLRGSPWMLLKLPMSSACPPLPQLQHGADLIPFPQPPPDPELDFLYVCGFAMLELSYKISRVEISAAWRRVHCMVPSMFDGDGGCGCLGLLCGTATSASASHQHLPLDGEKEKGRENNTGAA